MHGRSLMRCGALLGVLVVLATTRSAESRPLPRKPLILGPGVVLENAFIQIRADRVTLPPLIRSYVLPEGRVTHEADGTMVYSAVLATTRVEFGGGGFDFAPTVNARTAPDGRQTVRLGAVFNNRGSGFFDTQNTLFRLRIGIAAGGHTYRSSGQIYTSCLDGAARVTLADGSTAPICELVPGDRVRNPLTGAALEVEEIIRGVEVRPLVRMATARGVLRMSEGHPVWADGALVQAVQVRPGAKVRTATGPVGVTSLARPAALPGQRVYNLRFALNSSDWRDHVFLAEGLVVGDAWAQERLACPR